MMKKILILNGSNLNFLGKREPAIYGSDTLESINQFIGDNFNRQDVVLSFFQSNIEGELISAIQDAHGKIDGIVINAGAYTHTSIALADAIKSVDIPCVEVHISNVFCREEFRHHSFLSPVCQASLCGMGKFGYIYAVKFLLEGIN